jgi:hypothetical protein
MRVAASVAAAKERRPDQYCPKPRCLWRTGGGYCPRHAPTCITCSGPIEPGLARLGSTTCHNHRPLRRAA